MLKKSLIAIAVLACVAPAFAGTLKLDGTWPTTCTYTPQTICTLDVTIDVGYYIVVENEDPIKLTQGIESNPSNDASGATTYSGSKDYTVNTNFVAKLSASIASTDTSIVADGDLSVSITNSGSTANAGTSDPAVVSIGGDTVTIAVTANNVHIENLDAGSSDQTIAQVTVSAVPA
jgi:hypothetical protein